MALAKLTLLALILPLFYTAGEAANSAASTRFIKVSCSTTRYPTLCLESLSLYAATIKQSPRQMAQTALSVTLARAVSAKTFVKKLNKLKGLKPREYIALKDCSQGMADGADRLSKSVRELQRVAGKDSSWLVSNVQTWVSAALTDASTCLDGFAGRPLPSVTAEVTNVMKLTSNALALVNQFAAKL